MCELVRVVQSTCCVLAGTLTCDVKSFLTSQCMTVMAVVEREAEDGALYLVEDRASTFEGSSWPFDCGPCTPLKMAEAGFYYCGSVSSPDWVRCIVCHQDMEGWEETDDPRKEHKRNQPSCSFLKIKDPYKITFGDILDLEKSAFENYASIEEEKLSNDLDMVVDELREKLIEANKLKKQRIT